MEEHVAKMIPIYLRNSFDYGVWLQNLRKHRYRGVQQSLVNRYFLDAFADAVVNQLPLWLAPNTITVTGLAVVSFNLATLIYYDPLFLCQVGGASGPPQWIYYTWALGLFIWHTCDNIDGKQARRTGMASPLGELLDHCCDAVSNTVGLLLTYSSRRAVEPILPKDPRNPSLPHAKPRQIVAHRNRLSLLSRESYLTFWEQYQTGVLYLSPISGPNELIVVLQIIHALTGYFGTQIWNAPVLSLPIVSSLSTLPQLPLFLKTLALNESIILSSASILFLNAVLTFFNVYSSLKPNTSFTKPLLQTFSFVVDTHLHLCWIGSAYFFWGGGEDILHSEMLIPFICMWGIQYCHYQIRIVLNSITSTPFPLYDPLQLLTTIGALDINAPYLFGIPPIIQSSPDRTRAFIWFGLALSVGMYIRYWIWVGLDITRELRISLFSRRTEAKGEDVASNGAGRKVEY